MLKRILKKAHNILEKRKETNAFLQDRVKSLSDNYWNTYGELQACNKSLAKTLHESQRKSEFIKISESKMFEALAQRRGLSSTEVQEMCIKMRGMRNE